ncbi:multidrug ABC transporter ATP-binding protein [Cellulomonas hominis]|uniref:ABC-type multidrug transport system fused ATPase/permease subunit n=2 Tax=Cellulomonas hominis TaxID=156981 RepID=A0A511F9L6_9CELL|nr:ABC-type multidrug transport system fused ATPase/permease subunit [Cellulomonas hominis]GEL44957.1 multidrug ABC transporter ATP-binding protein [Cellulomonas hominis]
MPARSTTPRPATLTGSVLRRSLLLMGRGIASQPRTYVLAIGTSAAFGALTVAVSRVLGWATDDVVVPAIAGDGVARGRIWLAGGVLALVAVSLAAAVAGRRIFAGMGVADQQAMHRRAVTRQYLRLPMSWHRRHPTGQLLSNASADVEAATGVFNPLPFALGVVVMIAVAAVALLSTDVWLALAALVVLPAAVVANLVFQRRMSPAATRAQQLRAEVADIAHESFEAALLVKSLGTEDREERRFAERAGALRDANVRVGVVRAYFDPVIDMLPSIGTLLVLLVGVWRVSVGAVDTGDIVAAAYLLTLMAVPVRAFGWVLGELPRALVGHDRVARVVDAEGELAAGAVPLTRRPGGAALRMSGVGVRVPGPDGGPVDLLRDVDLDVAPGRVVAVVGPTGAGKTTLVSLVPRLTDPTTGTIAVDGTDVRDLVPGDLTGQVVLVGQQTFVFEDTVRGNVTLCDADDPAAPSDDEVWAALRLARVDGVVRELPGGLDAPLGERGSNLSGGQRQRLAIARALVRRPRLLVLDDATSAVDPRVEQGILTGLREHTGDGGTGPTVLLVAYRMSSVLLADEVVHVAGGRVVDRGTHAELLARDPGYRELATAYEQESERRAARRAEALAAGESAEEDDEDREADALVAAELDEEEAR